MGKIETYGFLTLSMADEVFSSIILLVIRLIKLISYLKYNCLELEQVISQFVWKYKKTSNSQSNLEKEEWNWRNQPA